jgi:hypothetical protein
MAEELEELCGKISLTEGERIGIQIDEHEVSEARVVAGKCLVGKVWADKLVNKEAFQSVMSNVWRTAGEVKFKDLKDNIWLFEFSDQVDKKRVMEGRPWSFDRQIIVLNEFDGSIPPSQLAFNHSPIWIQVHDMPLICMNKSVGTKIGSSLGELVDIDVAGDGMGWGSYLRLRVVIDLMKPLDRGRALSLAGKSSWVEFKYEKLPLFCYRCGCIIHGSNRCPVISNTRLNKEETKPWGSWLRAFDPKRKGARGGFGNRGETSQNQFREEGDGDGAQSAGRSTGKESFGHPGNPNRQPTPGGTAVSVESGTFSNGENVENQIREDIFPSAMTAGASSRDMGRKLAVNQPALIDMGPNKEHMGVGNLGLLGDDETVGTECLGLNKEVHERTSMDYNITGGVNPLAEADFMVPKTSIKTWKRLARGNENMRANVQSKRKAKRGRPIFVGNANDGGEQNGKRLKKDEVTSAYSGENMAEAVEQPRQEP